MRRRAFFGFLGGAAASGPTLAKSLSTEIAASGASLGYATGATESRGPIDSGEWKMRRIAELKAVIAGEDPNQARDRKMGRLYSLDAQERFRLDALRSVSPTSRHRMLVEGEIARRRRIEVANAEFSLIRFLSGN